MSARCGSGSSTCTSRCGLTSTATAGTSRGRPGRPRTWVQDTLARAFATLGRTYRPPANPKAWLFRVASNLWIDRARRARETPGAVPEQAVVDDVAVDRDAARTASADLVGVAVDPDPSAMRDPDTGTISGFLELSPRAEVRTAHDVPVVLLWYADDRGDVVRNVAVVDIDGDRIRHLRHYYYAPEALAEVCRELGVPFRTNGYRYQGQDQ